MITFMPLSGDARSSRTSPLCYLLQVDDVCILLDCGSPDWSPESPETPYPWENYCASLRQRAPSVDLVLLSHGDLAHAGLYPYAYSRWNLHAPTYSTLPVQAMARMAVTEEVESLRQEQDFDAPSSSLSTPTAVDGTTDMNPVVRGKCIATSQEVQDAFDTVNVLRFSQPCHLQGKCQGLTITPFNAGHTLGGTIWKIRSPSSGTIVYAVNMNHMRERHLDGTVLMRQSAGGIFEPLARPDLFITDAERASVTSSRRKDRDAALIDLITTTLASRSSILMPCDASTRVLEILVLLDQHWNYSRLRYPICFLSKTGKEMLTFVRSMMEWMGGTISKEDVGEDGTGKRQQNNKRKRDDDGDDEALGAFALRFPHLEFFPNPQALLQTYSSKEPKLILAVPTTLSHGPSRSLFSDFAAVPDNVLLLTQRGEVGTLGRTLFDLWNGQQRQDDKWDKGKIGRSIMLDSVLKLKLNAKVPLQGAELEAFREKERAAKEKEAAHQAALARSQRILEADEDESDSDESDSDSGSDTNDQMAADWEDIDADEGLTKQLLSFDIYLKGNVSRATSFFKSAGGQTQRFRMFPYVEKKRRVDEYGETIDVGMWLRKAKIFDADAETDEAKELRRRHQEKEDAKVSQLEPPSKFITTEVEVQCACRLLFVDLEGLNDGRAVKTIVPQVNPRKMIIVHATPEASDVLIESCGNIRAMTKDIFAPEFGQSVQIGQQTNSFSVSISDALLSSIRMSRFEDTEVGYVHGRIATHSSSTFRTMEPLGTSAVSSKSARRTDSAEPVARRLGMRPPMLLPHSMLIGELKLTALKSRLASIGVPAELVGEGVLVCGGGSGGDDILQQPVAVRKTGRGQVEIEGNVSDLYYTVRREIYHMHALVTA
ncbi:hypothetical protein FISHEDRAFT_41247 [Fistulina hepatica ATCC 64428]|nr:hypothetical protein FISHEDRAFT_41247 [Fistulina hepatica ATCC 64428]